MGYRLLQLRVLHRLPTIPTPTPYPHQKPILPFCFGVLHTHQQHFIPKGISQHKTMHSNSPSFTTCRKQVPFALAITNNPLTIHTFCYLLCSMRAVLMVLLSHFPSIHNSPYMGLCTKERSVPLLA